MDSQTKKATFPTSEEITRRLTSLCSESSMVETLYPQIARHAGQELLPEGVVAILTLEAYEFSKDYPPQMGAILSLYIPDWINILVDDKEVAETANRFLGKTKEKVAAKVKATTPPRVEPEGPIEDHILYLAIRKVADLVISYVNTNVTRISNKVWMEDRRGQGVNPYYNQTESGIFLDFYYRSINSIWTPWGEYSFGGSSCGSWEQITPKILKRLGSTEFMPETNVSYGVVGPVYSILKVDKLKLPNPKLRERQNFLDYEVAGEAWKNMTRRYQQEKGEMGTFHIA